MQNQWPRFINGANNYGQENNEQENNGQDASEQDNNGETDYGNGKKCNTHYCRADSDVMIEEANYTIRFDIYN